MSKMYDVIAKNVPDYLLEDPQGADAITVACMPGNGVIVRGTVMHRMDSGMYAPASEAEAAGNHILVVLDEETDTNADASIAENARAYRAGRLIASRVKMKDGADITPAIALELRKQGIVLGQLMDEAPEFNNSTESENT